MALSLGNVFGLEGKVAIVQRLQRFGTLKHSAVDQKAVITGLKQVAGSGDRMGCTVDMQGNRHLSHSLSSRRKAFDRSAAREIAFVG